MKWHLKAVGRLIVTLALMCCAVAFMFAYPKYSWTAVIVVSLLVIWDFMYYQDFEFFKIGKNGATAKLNKHQNKSSNSKVINKSQEIDFNKAFRDFETPGLDIMLIGQYRTPGGLEEFSKLVKKAKTANYPLKEDNAYLDSASTLQGHIVEQLFASMENYDKNHILTEGYKDLLRDALYESDYDKNQFTVTRIDLVEQLGHKEAINHRFERAISDLDKISADSKLT